MLRLLPTFLAGLVAVAGAAADARAQLPLDTPGTIAMAPVRNRVYVGDVAINHLVDGRLHVVDGDTGRYLGMLGTGFAGQFTQSPDRRELYVATTYLSRLQRGERTDVVEVYGADDLAFRHEIAIAPHRVQGLSYRGYVRTSSDGRLLYVLNATPAVSVSVVDLQLRRQVAEFDMPGCWGLFPAASHPRRFSTLCGDGQVATYTLNDDGTPPAQGGRADSARVFDPDGDALFVHAEQAGDVYWFVSFKGRLLAMDLGGERGVEKAGWSFVAGIEPSRRWRPGGYAPLALDVSRRRLYVGMHPNGKEGSHKLPASQIWAVDLDRRQVVARRPGRSAIALHAPASGDGLLYAIDGIRNGLVVMAGPALDVRRRVVPIGDAAVLLESR